MYLQRPQFAAIITTISHTNARQSNRRRHRRRRHTLVSEVCLTNFIGLRTEVSSLVHGKCARYLFLHLALLYGQTKEEKTGITQALGHGHKHTTFTQTPTHK